MTHASIISGKGSYTKIEDILQQNGCRKFLLVCGSSLRSPALADYFQALKIPHIVFNGFQPNPLYEDVAKGVALFRDSDCDAIVAVGGGSAIDTAKCIKLFCRMDPSVNYLEQEYTDSGIPLIALPTTAGSGSEATRYAVIYFEGKKQSVTHSSLVPDYAILEPEILKTLPIYQKKCTMLDALCQGVESWWSVNATEESQVYSKMAIETIVKYKDAYLRDFSAEAAEQMLLASNYAGRAINITQTTAPHAMSYKLTSLYRLPHGHAAAICLPVVWQYMTENPDKCIGKRGADYIASTFVQIAKALGAHSPQEAIRKWEQMLEALEIRAPKAADKEAEVEILAKSVNPIRLGNNPIVLSEETLSALYRKIVM